MRTRSEARRARELEHAQRVKKPEYTIDVPSDVVNEQLILAAEIVDDDVRKRLTKLFPPDAFYAEEHKAIQAGLVELERRKLAYDPATLVRLSPDVDIRILETLADARPDVPRNLDFHVETLQWDWQRARITQGPLAAIIEAIQNPKEAPDRVKTLLRQLGSSLEDESYGRARYLRDPKEVVRQAMQALRQRVEGGAFYPYGIDGLDYYEADAVDTKGRSLAGTRRIRPGAAPGTISMVTSVSGSGKTSYSGHLAINQAKQKRKVLYGAWEEEAPVTIQFLAVLNLGWSRSRILDGKSNRLKDDSDSDYEPLNYEELVTIEEEMDAISKYVHFFDNPFQRDKSPAGRRITNNDQLDIIQEHLEESGAEVFIADLWERCLVETRPENERLALYRQLAIAKEQRAHIVLVHQQRTKDIETRADKRPTREGIIGSGAWLDVCWLVMAPFLPAKWKKVPDDTMELYILKQKDGPWPLCVEFDWDPDRGQISKGRSVPVERYAESSDEAFGAPKPIRKRRGR